MIDVNAWKRTLEEAGLEVLTVGLHPQDPNTLLVYLNGNAGQWVGGEAAKLIESMPGVAGVATSNVNTIIKVWLA